jgi:two-component system sensor histidine kinase ChiS
MPQMNGYEVAAALSGAEETRSIPIVMVTGLAGEQDRLRALKAGAVDFLSKPVNPDLLMGKITSLARLKEYHDDMKRQRTRLTAEVAGKSGQLQAALDSFARFVPDEFLRCLSKKSIVDIALGDQVLTDMAILFSDMRSFTTLSEKMTPQQIFNFLNSYLARMNPFIWENGGFVDKYIGDGIMALFPTGAGSALNAAIAMLACIPVYNTQRAIFRYDPIRIGIGVHAGPVMLGVIGQERFMQGTVISDAVNIASRLEGLTKVYGVSLVVSSQVLFGLDNPNRYGYRFLDKVKVKGKEEFVSVYEVFDGDPPGIIAQKKKTREVFEKGVYEYHAGNFATAYELFGSIREDEKSDTPLDLYCQRCRRSMKLGTVESMFASAGEMENLP